MEREWPGDDGHEKAKRFPAPKDCPIRGGPLAVVTMGMAVFMTVIDQTIANVALPTIGMDLHVSPAESIWIINAFQLAVLLPMLPLAVAGDILGYKRVYLCGLSLFTLASLGCALSSSLLMLTMMRMLQGLGAAGVMSVNMALVRFIHPINRLGHGIGINAVIIADSGRRRGRPSPAPFSLSPPGPGCSRSMCPFGLRRGLHRLFRAARYAARAPIASMS